MATRAASSVPVCQGNFEDILTAPCRNCGKRFVRLAEHLRRTPCKAKYRKEEIVNAQAKRHKDAMQRRNERNRGRDEEGFKKKQAERQQGCRARERQVDEEGFKKTRAEEQQRLRARERQVDEEGFKKREAEGRESRRARERQSDESGFKKRRRSTNKSVYRARQETKLMNSSEGDRFKVFKDETKDGYVFACICCLKRFFKIGVLSPCTCGLVGKPPCSCGSVGKSVMQQIGVLKRLMGEDLFRKCIDIPFFRSHMAASVLNFFTS